MMPDHGRLYSDSEVIIHGLGAAINIAVELALSIVKRSLGDLVASPSTSTEPLIDDFEPLESVRQPLQMNLKE